MLVRSFRVPAYMNVEVHFTLYLDSITTIPFFMEMHVNLLLINVHVRKNTYAIVLP